MNETSNRPKPKKRSYKPRPPERGYVHKSPAVCVVVHDPTGKPMPSSDATRIIDSIYAIAVERKYLISFTRI